MSRKPTETKQKILDAGCELFAERGYRAVTAQDICSRAGANIASINYYFGSKENLYLHVWDRAFKITGEKYFKDEAHYTDPEKRLEYYVESRISTVLDEGPAGWLPKIIHNEMSNPSPIKSRELLIQRLEKSVSHMYELAKNFLGDNATDLQINLALNSFHSQCIHLNIMRARKLAFFAEGSHSDKAKIKVELLELIMGGMRSYREEIRRGES